MIFLSFTYKCHKTFLKGVIHLVNSHSHKIKPYLTTKTLVPENQETPIHFVTEDLVSDKLFYRRNHFPYPAFASSFYFLPIEGEVQTPTIFSLEQIYAMPSKTKKVVLECSGDKQELFIPKVFGEQMGKGAISQGIWKGVR